jgi:hypothetical protein
LASTQLVNSMHGARNEVAIRALIARCGAVHARLVDVGTKTWDMRFRDRPSQRRQRWRWRNGRPTVSTTVGDPIGREIQAVTGDDSR